MKRFCHIAGMLLVGGGLFVTLGMILMTIGEPSRFSPLTNLTVWILAGLVPGVVGAVLWFRSGKMNWGKATWFFVGVIVSWGIWSVIYFWRSRPHNLTATWPSELRAIPGDSLSWLRSAVARNVGGVVVCASAKETDPSAIIRSRGKTFPQILMSSDKAEGFVDSIILSAAGDQSITADLDAKGQIRKYTVSTGDFLGSKAVAMVDSDMDGQFDVRIGPGRHVYLWLNSAWRERMSSNGSTYVDLNGTKTEVVLTNGVWKLKKELSQPPAGADGIPLAQP